MRWPDATPRRQAHARTRTPMGRLMFGTGLTLWWLFYGPASLVCLLVVMVHSVITLPMHWAGNMWDELKRDWRRV